jgi:hypothetical protein
MNFGEIGVLLLDRTERRAKSVLCHLRTEAPAELVVVDEQVEVVDFCPRPRAHA